MQSLAGSRTPQQVALVVAVVEDQLREVFPGPDRQQIRSIDHAFGFRLGVKVIVRQAVPSGSGLA